ncbi:SWI/SNF chromatin-remodeling complex subunit [Komagataella phaffii CBS 7435]|uniref:Uncharacterized protein n=2 Tax=Komagataella phaffii TaxID=460519 RepID=C4R3R9_KOMPG|nr:uncharacterized protein PAS_chr3_1159 [Komagataella phaffii GS115]AOA63168.1 GQ67_03199T0 [Komagataella phaffii]CAH2450075.1 SWI/SNF chromatin-remodeling complex subunit [Komagataella phaffii CBS 7435]AOA68517.1 GQ68_03184T0 [Komagataella phaffii GS115]CAY70148.1 hypothetical protein PAS_chr3_1159 [Komagataella phaffii GS115]CCA40000.1 SWI/SNF chromatin-remodeling complex subunit [Komagataella phaffii CBS 7435]
MSNAAPNMQILQQLATLPPQQQQQILRQNPQLAMFLRQVQQRQQQFINKQGQAPPGMGVGAGIQAAQGMQGQGGPMMPEQIPVGAAGHPGSLAHGVPGVSPAISTPPVGSSFRPKLPGGSAPLQPELPRLSSLRYWSEKLEKEGKPVDTNTLLYEQIITRDKANIEARAQNEQEKKVLESLIKDLKFYNELKSYRMKSIQAVNNGMVEGPPSIWGEGYQGYGHGFTGKTTTQFVYPQKRKKYSRIPESYIPDELMEQQAESIDEWVPIRMDFDIERDNFKLNDTFLWNLNEKVVTLERFVAVLMEDYKFKNPLFLDTILANMKEQINEYRTATNTRPQDLRVDIKLDIAMGNNQLIDQFEWDISDPNNDPEEFATVLCAELAVPGEFVTAVAHSIREQVQIFIKALHLINYPFDGSVIEQEQVRRLVKPHILPNESILRSRTQFQDYSPNLLEISIEELQRLDKDKERESRRKRRGMGRVGRRNGLVLPELSDAPKTIRTPIASTVLPYGIEVGPSVDSFVDIVESIEDPKDPKVVERVREPSAINSSTGTPNIGGNNGVVSVQHDYGNSLYVTIKLRR